MSDLNTTTAIETGIVPAPEPTPEPTPAPAKPKAPKTPRKLTANPTARNAELTTPEAVIAAFLAANKGKNAADVSKMLTAVSKAARATRDTIKPESMPRKSDSSDVIRPLIWANPDKSVKQLTALAQRKMPTVKAATVAVFRGDFIKHLGYAPDAMLNPALRKWLATARTVK